MTTFRTSKLLYVEVIVILHILANFVCSVNIT